MSEEVIQVMLSIAFSSVPGGKLSHTYVHRQSRYLLLLFHRHCPPSSSPGKGKEIKYCTTQILNLPSTKIPSLQQKWLLCEKGSLSLTRSDNQTKITLKRHVLIDDISTIMYEEVSI